MREREGQLKFIVSIYNDHQPVNIEEVLGEERIEALEVHIQESADAWIQNNLDESMPYMEAQAEVY